MGHAEFQESLSDPQTLNNLVMPAQAASYGSFLIWCGDVNPPKFRDPGAGREPYYRWLGARDGILTVAATARHMSDPTFRAAEIATHEGDEEILEALYQRGFWVVDHENCRALGGRVSIAETMATANGAVKKSADFILGREIDPGDYTEVRAAKRDLLRMGRIHEPEKVIAHSATAHRRQPHLPKHPLTRTHQHGHHAEAFIVNDRPGTMLRATELDREGRPVRPPVYGIDSHIRNVIHDIIKDVHLIDKGAFDLAFALHAGAIAAEYLRGHNPEKPLNMYRVE